MGTKVKEKLWAGRTIAQGYWDGREHPSKQFLTERIAALSPINSILEIGCASGPNLYLLAKKLPHTHIVGIDINEEAVAYGNAQFVKEKILNVELLVGKADELKQYQDKAFDIVFTNALLIYIGPDKIKEVIKEMIRITRKALVLMELHSFQSGKKDDGRGSYYGGNWVRDYAALLGQFVPREKIRISKIPEHVWPVEPWRQLGVVVEVIM